MRIQAIFIAFALLSFIFGIILNKSITDYREVFSTPYTLLISIIILISAPLSPFVLFFSFLQFATNWIEKVITIKFTNSFRFFGNWIASFSLLKPMKNIRKSSKVLTLLSLSLGLLLFSISIVETERRVIESKELFLNGNSQYLRMRPQPSSKDLFMSDVKMILTSIQEENEQRSLYEAMNWDIDLYLNDLYLFEQNRTSQVFVSIISNENYLRYMDIPDSWMEGMTPYDALNSLNIANHVLIPANYKQYGYDLGDNLTFSYRSQIGGTENFTLIISGFYKIFPLCSFTSSGGAFSNIIIGENTNLSAAQIWRIHLMFYSKNQNDPINRDAISSFLEVKYPDFELLYDYINRPNIYPDEDFYTFYPTIIDFIELEGYYFVVFIGFALIFQIDLYLRNQIHDFALFKSYGMKNSQILKIVCLESLGFILIALVISFIGLIASTMISVFFNIIEQPLPYFSRNINFLNWKYVIGQLILIGIFLGATVIFTLFHTHKISHPDEIVKELKTI